MASDRIISENPENLARALQIVSAADAFRNPLRQRYLTAAVMARAISNQEVFELVMDAVNTSDEELQRTADERAG